MRILAAALILSASIGTASAVPISYNFTGVMTSSSSSGDTSALPDYFPEGSSWNFQGTVSIDSSQAPSIISSFAGLANRLWVDGSIRFSVSVPTATILGGESDQRFFASVQSISGLSDTLGATLIKSDSPVPNGTRPTFREEFFFTLDRGPISYGIDGLPEGINPSLFASNTVSLRTELNLGFGSRVYMGSLTSIEKSIPAVPLPAPIFLLLLSAGMLGILQCKIVLTRGQRFKKSNMLY